MPNPTPAERILSALAEMIRDEVLEQLKTISAFDPNEYLPHYSWGLPRRRAAELARAKLIPARRRGRLWMARRCDVAAWAASGAAHEPRATPDDDDGVDWAAVGAARSARNAHLREQRELRKAQGLPAAMRPTKPKKR